MGELGEVDDDLVAVVERVREVVHPERIGLDPAEVGRRAVRGITAMRTGLSPCHASGGPSPVINALRSNCAGATKSTTYFGVSTKSCIMYEPSSSIGSGVCATVPSAAIDAHMRYGSARS